MNGIGTENRKACHIYMHDQQAKHKALQQSRCTPGHYMHVVPISKAKLEQGPYGVNRIHHLSASLVNNCLYMFHHIGYH